MNRATIRIIWELGRPASYTGRVSPCLRGSAFLLGLALLLGSALLPLSARADKVHPNAGTSSAAFLKIGVGARPIGMGEAYTAAADDIYSVYWNPAGLAGQRRKSMTYMFRDSFQDIRHDFLGYAQPLRGGENGAVIGLGINSLRVSDDLERRSGLNEGNPLSPISASEGSFGASDLALSASYSRILRDVHAGAMTLKIIRQSIDDESATTAALDFGWQRRELRPNLDVGAVLQNLGPGVKFQSRFALPLTLKLGTAYRLDRFRSLLAFDIAVPRDDYPLLAWGVETRIIAMLSIRAGYLYRWNGNPNGTLSGVRTGGGFDYLGKYTLDYAFAPFGELGRTHQLSLGMRFGASANGSKTPAKKAKVKAKVEAKTSAVVSLAQEQAQAGTVATPQAGRPIAPMKPGTAELPPPQAGRPIAPMKPGTAELPPPQAGRPIAPMKPGTAELQADSVGSPTGSVGSAAGSVGSPPTVADDSLPAVAGDSLLPSGPKPFEMPREGFTQFKILTQLKTRSSSVQIFEVQAHAPDDDWEIRTFRLLVQENFIDGYSLGVLKADASALPYGMEAKQAYWILPGSRQFVRSMNVHLRAPASGDTPEAFGLFGTQWRPLGVKASFEGDEGAFVLFTGGLPRAIAIK